MKRLLSMFAAIGALSLAMSPVAAPAAQAHHILGTISGKQTGTVVKHAGNKTFTMHFNSQGKLLSATTTGGAHGMTAAKATISKGPGPKKGSHGYYASWCYYYVCDDYGYCYIYYYVC